MSRRPTFHMQVPPVISSQARSTPALPHILRRYFFRTGILSRHNFECKHRYIFVTLYFISFPSLASVNAWHDSLKIFLEMTHQIPCVFVTSLPVNEVADSGDDDINTTRRVRNRWRWWTCLRAPKQQSNRSIDRDEPQRRVGGEPKLARAVTGITILMPLSALQPSCHLLVTTPATPTLMRPHPPA